MSCCLSLQPEQIPKKLPIITVSLPRECRKSPPSCFPTQNIPSLPVTSSFNLYLSYPCWEPGWVLQATCFPAFGLRPCSCETPPTSFLILALLLYSKGLQLSPRWVVTTVNQYANRKACVPLTQLSSPCAMCRLHNHRADAVTLHSPKHLE